MYDSFRFSESPHMVIKAHLVRLLLIQTNHSVFCCDYFFFREQRELLRLINWTR